MMRIKHWRKEDWRVTRWSTSKCLMSFTNLFPNLRIPASANSLCYGRSATMTFPNQAATWNSLSKWLLTLKATSPKHNHPPHCVTVYHYLDVLLRCFFNIINGPGACGISILCYCLVLEDALICCYAHHISVSI